MGGWKIEIDRVANRQWLGGKLSMAGWLDSRVGDWMVGWYDGIMAGWHYRLLLP